MNQAAGHTDRTIENEPLEYLRQWRHHVAISRRAGLAERAGLDPSTVHRIEVFGTPARPRTVRLLAKALEISPSQLRRPPQ
jgi:hypothetical protein